MRCLAAPRPGQRPLVRMARTESSTSPRARYDVVATRLGFLARRNPGIRVADGQTVQVDIRMAEIVTQLNPAVVVASRQQEKVLDAPASVSVIETRRSRNGRR